ncbi:MAG: hypothetical protein K8R58_10025, partial [Bacteroidales bacterium]|nr:hypothetical protein [Bacteroidales bacterium]
MKKNKLIIIITIILAVIAVILIYSHSKGTFKSELKNFAINDTTNITKIYMVDKKNQSVLLERINAGEWKLNNNYKVRKSGINMLLKTMLNIIPKAPVPKSAHNKTVALLASSSIKVEIYQMVYRIDLFNTIKLFPREKLTKTYYVGNVTQDNIGTFMLMENSSVPFV